MAMTYLHFDVANGRGSPVANRRGSLVSHKVIQCGSVEHRAATIDINIEEKLSISLIYYTRHHYHHQKQQQQQQKQKKKQKQQQHHQQQQKTHQILV